MRPIQREQESVPPFNVLVASHRHNFDRPVWRFSSSNPDIFAEAILVTLLMLIVNGQALSGHFIVLGTVERAIPRL